MINELLELYRRNFPKSRRNENTVRSILSDPDNAVIERRDGQGALIGASVINENTVLMLAVDREYRRRGIGSYLLEESEKLIKSSGYRQLKVGAGAEYILPGVPTSKRYYHASGEALFSELDETSSEFFEKRGYYHSWDCNCFDMTVDLKELICDPLQPGDTINGISYRLATPEDINAVCECVNDAHSSFTRWYNNDKLYGECTRERVLIATCENDIAGALIVSEGTERAGTGSLGCTAVRHTYRGKGIATNLVKLGTKYLKEAGLNEGYVGYTYSGLDVLYGYSGYRICTYYMMAKKDLQ